MYLEGLDGVNTANHDAVKRLAAAWNPPDFQGILALREVEPNRACLCLETNLGGRHVLLSSQPIEIAVLDDASRKHDAARWAVRFFESAARTIEDGSVVSASSVFLS